MTGTAAPGPYGHQEEEHTERELEDARPGSWAAIIVGGVTAREKQDDGADDR